MDWSNERYVRAYVRDTADYRGLCWQARLCWWELLRKADRSGVIETKHGARGLAALLSVPIEVVQPAIAELISDGCLVECRTPPGYVIPNYGAANETPMTEAERKRTQRDRAKVAGDVTKRPDMSGRRPPTSMQRDAVTTCPDTVTPNLTKPNQTEPEEEENPLTPLKSEDPAERVPLASPVSVKSKPGRKAKPKPGEPTTDELAIVRLVLDKLGARSGVKYGGSQHHTSLIVRQLRLGVTRWDLRRIIGYCADELDWQDKPEMRVYLRPETLFGPETIGRYLDAARAWHPGIESDLDKPQESTGCSGQTVPRVQAIAQRDGPKVSPQASYRTVRPVERTVPANEQSARQCIPAADMDSDPAFAEPSWMHDSSWGTA